MNSGLQPKPNDDYPEEFRPKDGLTWARFWAKVLAWFEEQTALLEAFFVAVSFHVLLFPLIWFAGWALPWPKPPSMTTVIEIDLTNWPTSASPTSIEEIFNTKMHEMHVRNHR